MAPEETSVAIDHDVDIVAARRKARELAKQVGFSGSDLTIIATAISEVARNIVVYANRGEIILSTVQQGSRRGVLVVARDQVPAFQISH